jgi:hypothetical protein
MKEWQPSPKQRRVYNARQRYINALGDPRSGKSEGFFHKGVRECFYQPGLKWLITRDSGTPLLNITYKHFFEKHIITPTMIIGGLDGITKKPWPIIPLVTGSEVHFVPYDEMDTTKGGGGEFGLILIEEAQRFIEKQWHYMDTRLSQRYGNAISPDGRRYISKIEYNGLWTTQNTAGRGYLYRIFTKEHPLSYYGNDPEFRGFKFYLFDNPYLKPEYVKAMMSKPEHIRRKLLGANEDPSEGLVFPDFTHAINVFQVDPLKPWYPPPHWRVLFGEDYGFQTSAVGLWAAISDDPAHVIIFKEHRTSHKTIPVLCEEFVQCNKDIMNHGSSYPETGRIDPATHMRDAKSLDAKTVYELHRDQDGMDFLIPAKRQRVMDRVQYIRDLMVPDPKKTHHPITNEFRREGWPTLIFCSNCEGLIKEVEDWELKEASVSEKTIEKPEEKNDHGPDALSYLLQAFRGDASEEHYLTKELRENTPQERLKKEIFKDISGQLNKGNGPRRFGDMVL